MQIDIEDLRCAIRNEYAEVAKNPQRGFHFHTGRKLARLLGYREETVNLVPSSALESFAGTGNPFRAGFILEGEKVVDVGSGSGFDSLIASYLVGDSGQVIGVDMTPEMLQKARIAAGEAGVKNIEFLKGHAESLPVPDDWADVVISNGVMNLCPDKLLVLKEMFRVLKPGGRIQIGDIIVEKPVSDKAKQKIDLWTG